MERCGGLRYIAGLLELWIMSAWRSAETMALEYQTANRSPGTTGA